MTKIIFDKLKKFGGVLTIFVMGLLTGLDHFTSKLSSITENTSNISTNIATLTNKKSNTENPTESTLAVLPSLREAVNFRVRLVVDPFDNLRSADLKAFSPRLSFWNEKNIVIGSSLTVDGQDIFFLGNVKVGQDFEFRFSASMSNFEFKSVGWFSFKSTALSPSRPDFAINLGEIRIVHKQKLSDALEERADREVRAVIERRVCALRSLRGIANAEQTRQCWIENPIDQHWVRELSDEYADLLIQAGGDSFNRHSNRHYLRKIAEVKTAVGDFCGAADDYVILEKLYEDNDVQSQPIGQRKYEGTYFILGSDNMLLCVRASISSMQREVRIVAEIDRIGSFIGKLLSLKKSDDFRRLSARLLRNWLDLLILRSGSSDKQIIFEYHGSINELDRLSKIIEVSRIKYGNKIIHRNDGKINVPITLRKIDCALSNRIC